MIKTPDDIPVTAGTKMVFFIWEKKTSYDVLKLKDKKFTINVLKSYNKLCAMCRQAVLK